VRVKQTGWPLIVSVGAVRKLGFSDEAGAEEALRCMGCDLRFMVAKMVAQPPLSAAKAKG